MVQKADILIKLGKGDFSCFQDFCLHWRYFNEIFTQNCLYVNEKLDYVQYRDIVLNVTVMSTTFDMMNKNTTKLSYGPTGPTF